MNKFIVAIVASLAIYGQVASSDDLFKVTPGGTTATINTRTPNHHYPAAGIKVISECFEPVSGCKMNKNGYCLFAVSDTQAANITFSGGFGEIEFDLCLNGTGPTSCQRYSDFLGKRLYVTNSGADQNDPSAVSVCATSADGLANCVPAGNVTNNFHQPVSISINADNTFAYVVNQAGQNVSVYPINSNGTFGNVTQSLSFTTGHGGTAISPDSNTLFVTNYDTQEVIHCTINAGNGMLSSCLPASGTSSTAPPSGIILNSAGTIAYVASLGSTGDTVDQTAFCTVSGTNFSCDNSGAANALPVGLAFSADESQVYVTNTKNDPMDGVLPSVQVCTIDGGALDCRDSGHGDQLSHGIVVEGTTAYISNFENNTISFCTISTEAHNKGQFTGCSDSGLGTAFNAPAMMAFSN